MVRRAQKQPASSAQAPDRGSEGSAPGDAATTGAAGTLADRQSDPGSGTAGVPESSPAEEVNPSDPALLEAAARAGRTLALKEQAAACSELAANLKVKIRDLSGNLALEVQVLETKRRTLEKYERAWDALQVTLRHLDEELQALDANPFPKST